MVAEEVETELKIKRKEIQEHCDPFQKYVRISIITRLKYMFNKYRIILGYTQRNMKGTPKISGNNSW